MPHLTRRRWPALLVAIVALVFSITAARADAQSANGVQSSKSRTSAERDSAVNTWNGFASNLVAANLAPGPQTHALAIAHIAVHDALNAIDPRYEPYAFVGSAPRASAAAAVAAAAHDTLGQADARGGHVGRRPVRRGAELSS